MVSAEPGPFGEIKRWQEDALRSGKVLIPEAACLSTVDPEGWPEGRMVLVKNSGPEGFVFFTNTGSPKAKALAAAPRACLTFYWESLGRQLRIQGAVELLSGEESAAYFSTRPRWSQIGAWASEQSRPLEKRGALARRVASTALRFLGRTVPPPPHWGGYRLLPRSVEFWSSRAHRLHDRLLYRRKPDGGWDCGQLYP